MHTRKTRNPLGEDPLNNRCTGAFCGRPARPNDGASHSNGPLAAMIVTQPFLDPDKEPSVHLTSFSQQSL